MVRGMLMGDDSQRSTAERGPAVSFGRLRTGLLWFAGAFVVALVAIQAAAYWVRYDAAIETAERRADNLALILKEHIEQTVAAADAALRQIVIQNRRLGGPEGSPAEWTALLDAARSGLSSVGSLSITDQAGIIRHSTIRMIVGQSRAENFVVRTLKETPTAGLVADTPFRALTTGEMLMPVGRRLEDGRGGFQGAVVATIELALLREFYRSVAAGSGAVVRVLHPSGVVFFREPSRTDPVGQAVADDPAYRLHRAGRTAARITAPIERDGAVYISAFYTTNAPPLIVAVSLRRADVLETWFQDLALGAGVTALFGVALLFAAWQMRRHLAAREAAERIGARRQREMAIAQTIANFGSLAIDVPGGTVRPSPQFNRIVGWPAERETASLEEFLALVEEKDRAKLRDAFIGCSREGGSYRLEFGLRRADGEVCRFWSEGFWHNAGASGPSEIVAFCQDVTERRTIEERLRQSQKMEAVGQLTGGIAHDFNNLLTVLLGGADMLAERLRHDPQLKRQAENLLAAAQRGAELTQRLLAFARPQPLEPQPLDVNRLLAGIDPLLRRTLGEHIDIELVRAAGLWPAFADRPQVETAILNLAINARDAMSQGGRLTIETANAHIDQAYAEAHVDVTPGQYVMIAVADTGTGMAADVVARAFEPFFTTKATGKGTGLGLSMVYGFVKQSGGHVKIYSEPGKGTTVRMYLPRAFAEAAAEERRAEDMSPGRGERILVVEDDGAVREFAEQQLRRLGYTVAAVASGPAALEALGRGERFDLLFTDIVMPGGMNGRELADAAHKHDPALKVLFTSGYAENAVIHHGHLQPGVVLLQKPYRRETLAAKVRAVLDAGGRMVK